MLAYINGQADGSIHEVPATERHHSLQTCQVQSVYTRFVGRLNVSACTLYSQYALSFFDEALFDLMNHYDVMFLHWLFYRGTLSTLPRSLNKLLRIHESINIAHVKVLEFASTSGLT